MTKQYSRPTLLVQGKLEALTQGSRTGNALDNTFPTGTPFGDLTFS